MDVNGRGGSSTLLSEEEMDLRRGPWTVEEDLTLINYIATHGEGRWNSLARCAGLKRTGKSCRLRWLNYLRPDVRRGNITLEEQLLILELHGRWGNRWSKIAQHLPGRTDNEIKNYWRTRVQKHAKQLKCDVNSKQFKDTMRYLWMPRLVERIQAAAAGGATSGSSPAAMPAHQLGGASDFSAGSAAVQQMGAGGADFYGGQVSTGYTPENSSTAASSDSFAAQVSPVSDLTEIYNFPVGDNHNQDYFQAAGQVGYTDTLISPSGYFNHGLDFQSVEPNSQWYDGNDNSTADIFWNGGDIWSVQPQFINNNI